MLRRGGLKARSWNRILIDRKTASIGNVRVPLSLDTRLVPEARRADTVPWDRSPVGAGFATRQPVPVTRRSASFVGGIARRGGWHASAPMAKLEFDTDELIIRPASVAKRLGLHEVRASRRETKAIRLSTGVLAVRVSVIQMDGMEVEPYFTVMRRRPVRNALEEQAWPVVEDRWKFGRRS